LQESKARSSYFFSVPPPLYCRDYITKPASSSGHGAKLLDGQFDGGTKHLGQVLLAENPCSPSDCPGKLHL
jgi:hypothetical protein